MARSDGTHFMGAARDSAEGTLRPAPGAEVGIAEFLPGTGTSVKSTSPRHQHQPWQHFLAASRSHCPTRLSQEAEAVNAAW